MGIPVLVLAESAAVPLPALARAQAAVAAALSVAFPAWLTLSFGGRAALRRAWAPSLAAGAAYAIALWWMVSRVSLHQAALTASLAALAATAAPLAPRSTVPFAGRWRGACAWWPWAVLMLTVLVWSLPPVARTLARCTLVLPMPALHPAPSWRVDLAASPGTAILAAVAVCSVAARASVGQIGAAARATVRQLGLPAASMLAMFALAQVMNASGMTHALAHAAAGAGEAFPFVSPFVSWLGTAIAGSNTASNALLGQFQAATAAALGQDPVLAAAVAGAAAALGKMAAPQVIAAAVGAVGIAGEEGRLLRIGLAHGLLWTTALGIAGLLIAR
jgi:L-lactate permease